MGTNLVENFEKKQMQKFSESKDIPSFQAGDTLKVHVKIVEGKVERVQIFEGLCIARSNRGISSSFKVRKISNGEGVERLFPIYSPFVVKIEVVRRGDVRRAKLYYMRGLTGKAARIKEKKNFAHTSKSTSGKEKHIKKREERKLASDTKKKSKESNDTE